MAQAGQTISIGQLKGCYGLQGWLWVYSNTDPMENIFNYQPWYAQSATGLQQLDVLKWKAQGKGLVVLLKQAGDRTAAEKLVGTELLVDTAALPALAANEYYWNDLIGLQVIGALDGQPVLLGVVHHLFETGANDVMVVAPTAGSYDQEERLIPWHDSVLTSVDKAAGKIVVDWQVDY